MAQVSRSAAISVLAAIAFAAPAAAGPPGSWTQVTNLSSDGSNADEASLARNTNGVLNILWVQDTTVLNTQVSADAQSVLGPHTVFTYPNAANDGALLAVPGGGLRAFFSGLYPDDPHDVGMSTATSVDGVSWTVQPTLASASEPGQRSSVYVASGIGATLFANGTPLSVWGDSAPGEAGYHVGTSDKTPDVHFGGNSATVGSPEAATDSDTGAVAVGWNDLDTGKTLVGIVQQTTSPWFPLGTPVSPPNANAPDALHPVGMTGRSGGAGGIYVAYLRGDNPFTSPAAVWRVGAPNSVKVSKGEARFPGVTMGPGGRLWAFWKDDADDDLHARRSNAAADAWGADVLVKPPGGTASVLWSLKGEGGAAPCGALDLVALATVGDDTANFHQRVLAGLTLKKKVLNGKKGKKAKVRFTTLDAGDPVNAVVTVGSKQKATGDDGKVKFKIKRKRRTRKVKATASADCYADAAVRVKIKKLSI